MLSHDLATTVVTERDRVIRDVLRSHARPARPSLLARVVALLGGARQARPGRRPGAASTRLADMGGAVSAVSARARDTHGQGAC
jgi:hypothetical protein